MLFFNRSSPFPSFPEHDGLEDHGARIQLSEEQNPPFASGWKRPAQSFIALSQKRFAFAPPRIPSSLFRVRFCPWLA
jgi:hypothetical protein